MAAPPGTRACPFVNGISYLAPGLKVITSAGSEFEYHKKSFHDTLPERCILEVRRTTWISLLDDPESVLVYWVFGGLVVFGNRCLNIIDVLFNRCVFNRLVYKFID